MTPTLEAFTSNSFPFPDLLRRFHGVDMDDLEQDPDFDEDNIPEEDEDA